jgi:uncharacterized protein YceH (UPF0502 family)
MSKITAKRMARFRAIHEMAKQLDIAAARDSGDIELYLELRERTAARGARRALRNKGLI